MNLTTTYAIAAVRRSTAISASRSAAMIGRSRAIGIT